MHKPGRLASCGLVAAALAASGCGSSKTASTPKTTSASTTATGPTANPATSAQQAPQASKAHAPAATTPSGRTTAPQTSAPAPVVKAKPEPKAPPKGGKYDYPLEEQRQFIATCTAAHSSKSSCECIIEKYARKRVEEGQSLAELLGIEVGLKEGLRLPPRALRIARECKSPIV